MGSTLPVMLEIARPDGVRELVRVGTARRDGSYFVLDLGALRIGSAPPLGSTAAASTAPLAAAHTVEDLEYIAARARKTLADASKSRWHAQERALLEQVEFELSRCRGDAAARDEVEAQR
jgi:hypothetical protein